ncbi:obg-like ATPase 1 isoform X3 [Ovis aries]|uniref:obg-like ATPase 1 isoform X3 n=1 Tax=Ovis aries TaxID=9940 RepID=UPI0029528F6E|nr:obg-like ATPase 1 isoform X3 [Ovis aries]
MPPKKGGDGIKPPPIIGRFGTSLKIGIVGLPNVGKSTFFNVLTNSQASAENFPFCTIDPNESRVPVPDERFDFLCQYHKPASKIPAFLNVVDIAGLVKGAHNGQGLGNAFLSHISACDGIFHLTRAFEDDDITHVEGSVDPVRDIEIIHEELQLKDEEMIGPIIDKLEKVAVRGGDKKLKPEYDIMCKVKSWVIDQKKPVRFYHDWNDKEIEVLNKHLFLTSKPMVYLVNLSEKDYIRKKNKCTSVVSDSVRPHRWQPTRLPRPWDSPGKNTGVGCHLFSPMRESEVAQSCPILSDPMDCSLPGFSVHGIFQARVLEWGAIAFSIKTVNKG